MGKRFAIILPVIVLLVIGIVVLQPKASAPTTVKQQTPTSTSDWQTYTSDTFDFSVSYPNEFEVTTNGEYSVLIVKKVEQPGQGPANFVYISVVPEEMQNADGVIYNYNKMHMDSLYAMEVNEEKPLAGEDPGLREYITYKRLADTKIAGSNARVFINNKPWEFPMGTREYRYVIDVAKRTYILGGYISTTDNHNYSIAEETFQDIIDSFTLPTPSKN